MPVEKRIVIGCDDTATLSVILNSLKETTSFSPAIITAIRLFDLAGIVKSLDPDLIVLCFRNNQAVLNDYDSYIKKKGIPLLCLTRKSDTETLYWNKNTIVFTYPLDHITKQGYLHSRINSIFLLHAESSKMTTGSTFADAAIQQHNQAGNNRNLSRYVMELDQKMEVLLKIKDRIADLYPHVNDPARAELLSIANSIKISANNNKLWDDFKLYFEETNPGFLLELAQKYPLLTPVDLKYCCYLKMNMSNDDIRNLLGIDQRSVRTHKYRLKKKMALSAEQDLRSHLRTINL